MSEINDNYISDGPIVESEEVTPKDLLKFAKYILLSCVFIFLFSCITELYIPYNKVFEICKTIIPPIVTLVIGFYFVKSK